MFGLLNHEWQLSQGVVKLIMSKRYHGHLWSRMHPKVRKRLSFMYSMMTFWKAWIVLYWEIRHTEHKLWKVSVLGAVSKRLFKMLHNIGRVVFAAAVSYVQPQLDPCCGIYAAAFHFFPDFLIPPPRSGPFAAAFAAASFKAFCSSFCFCLNWISDSSRSFFSFLAVLSGFFFPPSRPDIPSASVLYAELHKTCSPSDSEEYFGGNSAKRRMRKQVLMMSMPLKVASGFSLIVRIYGSLCSSRHFQNLFLWRSKFELVSLFLWGLCEHQPYVEETQGDAQTVQPMLLRTALFGYWHLSHAYAWNNKSFPHNHVHPAPRFSSLSASVILTSKISLRDRDARRW